MRRGVALGVSSTVVTSGVWADVLALVDEAIRCGAVAVRLAPESERRPRTGTRAEDPLVWLAAHQAADGRWSAAGFGDACDGNPMRRPAGAGAGRADVVAGAGRAGYDVGATGLSLLAFLGAGYTNRGRHPFARNVSKGLRFLRQVQRSDGAFASPAGPWSSEQHAIASLALVEAFGMTGSPIFRTAARRGLDHLANGYGFASRADLPALAFAVAALGSAEIAIEDARQRDRDVPLHADPAFVDEVVAIGLDLSGSRDPCEAAIGLFGRIPFVGEPARGEELGPVASIVGRQPPVRIAEDAPIDAMRWLFSTLALHQVGDAPWISRTGHLRDAVVGTQRADGAVCCHRGSWDPIGHGADRFGRVGATALGTLCLEVFYRYDRVFGRR